MSFCTLLGFTKSRSYPLNVIDGFYHMTTGTFKRDRLIIITGIDKVHWKADCIQGSKVNGRRQAF